MFFFLLESELAVAEHQNIKDDGTGRYAEQLSGHARHWTVSEAELTESWQHLWF